MSFEDVVDANPDAILEEDDKQLRDKGGEICFDVSSPRGLNLQL